MTLTKNQKTIVLIAFLALIAVDASAQVTTTNAAGSWLQNKGNLFLGAITSVTTILMVAAWTFAGYKFIFVEGTKIADLKGLFIGGLCCAGAATFSALMMT